MKKFLDYADCENCPLKNCKCVEPKINKEAKLIILSEAPGAQEVRAKEFFGGQQGKVLEESLALYDVKRSDVHVTGTCLCKPHKTLSPTEWKQAIICCRLRLYHELQQVNCNYILGLGVKALQAITKKAKIFPWIGAPLNGVAYARKTKRTKKDYHLGELCSFKKYEILPTIHPSYILRGNFSYLPVMQRHLGWAWGLANKELPKWRWPNIYTQPNENMETALDSIYNSGLPIGVDIETQGLDPMVDKIMCIGIANKNLAVCMPVFDYQSKGEHVKGYKEYSLGPILFDKIRLILESDLPKVMQNGIHDVLGIESQLGIKVNNYAFDTLTTHALVAPRLKHDLGFMAACHFYAPRWKTLFKVETDAKGLEAFTKRPQEELRDYCAKDAYMTIKLLEPLQHEANLLHKGQSQNKQMLDLLKVSMQMKAYGIPIDRDEQNVLREELELKVAAAKKELNTLASRPVNINALADLRQLFFTDLGVVAKKRTATDKEGLDVEVLNEIKYHPDPTVQQAANYVLNYRKYNKLLATYVNNLDLDTLHVDWKTYGTRTGRWSANPGVQTIPKNLRAMFKSSGDKWMIKADYSQLEVRIISLLANDEILIEAYNNDADVHTMNAQMLFGTQEVSPNERKMAKIFVYAANYGGTSETIWQQMVTNFPSLTLLHVQRMLQKWLAGHPKILLFQNKLLRTAREKGYVECPISGRRQYYTNGQIDPNEIYNYPIQGTGADIINAAVIELAETLDWKNEGILLQVHDELVIECEDLERGYDVIKKCMEREVELNGYKMRFPIDVSVGFDWKNMVDITTAEEARCLNRL